VESPSNKTVFLGSFLGVLLLLPFRTDFGQLESGNVQARRGDGFLLTDEASAPPRAAGSTEYCFADK